MPINDPKRSAAGFMAVPRGVNSGQDPNLLAPDELAMLVNGTCRGGNPQCRPGFRKIDLTFDTDAFHPHTQAFFEEKLWQGAHAYEPSGESPFIVAAVGGRYFKIGIDSAGPSARVQDISIFAATGSDARFDLNSSLKPRAWFVQAEDFLIGQDGQSVPIIFDGTQCRRAADHEVPPGTVMEYALGRLWVARPNGRAFVAGDLVYGPSGTAPYGYRDAVLKFTEREFLNEGGDFAVPGNVGPIRAMRVLANLDTSLGQGPLEIFTTRAAFSVNAPFDRTQWKDTRFPIQATSLISYGALSQNSTVNIGNDLWYRALDGIRSFVVARRDFGSGSWGNTPMSHEMDRVIRYDDPALLEHSSAVLFDNRLLMTCSPVNAAGRGVAHRGLIVLDFHEVTSLRRDGTPAYDGVWTGLRILQILKLDFGGNERCFAFTLSPSTEPAENGKIELYEITRDEKFDNGSHPIVWSFETPSYRFADSGVELKRLQTGDLWIDNLAGTVSFDVQYRPDQYPGWVPWHSWSECASADCSPPGCDFVPPNQPQYRPRMMLPQPGDQIDASTKKPFRNAYEFQQRIEITGHCRVKKSRLVTLTLQEQPYDINPTAGQCQKLQLCYPELFEYQIADQP